jgi:hypothetical protein
MSEPDTGRVECTSGHTYAQEPRTVIWQGCRYAVTAVVSRWRTPEGPAFRLETTTGVLFDVQYHELEDVWMIRVIPAAE